MENATLSHGHWMATVIKAERVTSCGKEQLFPMSAFVVVFFGAVCCGGLEMNLSTFSPSLFRHRQNCRPWNTQRKHDNMPGANAEEDIKRLPQKIKISPLCLFLSTSAWGSFVAEGTGYDTSGWEVLGCHVGAWRPCFVYCVYYTHSMHF